LVSKTLDDLIGQIAKIKRYGVAGKKVIFNMKNMIPNKVLAFSFKVKAL